MRRNTHTHTQYTNNTQVSLPPKVHLKEAGVEFLIFLVTFFLVHPFIHPFFFNMWKFILFCFFVSSQNGESAPGVEDQSILGWWKQPGGFRGWKEVETLEDHPIPGWTSRHVYQWIFLCAYGEWFFVPYKLGCSRTPSKWPKWLINGGDPKHLLTSPGYVRPGSRSSKWVASQPTLPLTYPAWLWLGLTIGFRGPLGVAGWPVSTGCCNDFV